MTNTAFAATGTDAVYLPLETDDPSELQEVMNRLSMRGMSITMPLKQSVLPMLAQTDADVAGTQACNTLVRSPTGSLSGYNTDIAGILKPLEQRLSLEGARILVLGAGGAARAAVYGLRQRGAHVDILNRTPHKAQSLAGKSGAHVRHRETLAQTRFDAVINTTPYGMRHQQSEAPIHPNEMNCSVFFDLVYNPVETPLTRIARQRGITVIAGVEMFVEQGVQQFELWLKRDAPREAMLRAVFDDLSAQED